MCLNLSTKLHCTKYLIRQNIWTHGMYPIDSHMIRVHDFLCIFTCILEEGNHLGTETIPN